MLGRDSSWSPAMPYIKGVGGGSGQNVGGCGCCGSDSGPILGPGSWAESEPQQLPAPLCFICEYQMSPPTQADWGEENKPHIIFE